MGRLEDSIEHYKSFLRDAKPEGKLREYVEKFIDEQSAELARQREAKRFETERAARERERKAQEQRPRGSPLVPAPPIDVEPWYRDAVGWSLGGAGVAVFGVGLGLFINGAYVRGDAENASNQSAAEDQFRRADIQQLSGGAAMTVGTGLMIAGVVRLIATETPAERLVVLTTPRGLVVGLGGTF
jgi:anti-sigma factor RsiW